MIGPKYLSLPKSFIPIKNKINFRAISLFLKASHHVVSYKDDNRYQASFDKRLCYQVDIFNISVSVRRSAYDQTAHSCKVKRALSSLNKSYLVHLLNF